MKVLTLVSAAAAAIAITTAPAAARAWRQVGYQQADFRSDTDTVRVAGRQRDRMVRVCVSRAPLRMRSLRVVFANGAEQNVRVRQNFRPGSCTRAIDLRGRRRNITRIEMTYDKIAMRRPAIVRVFAR